MMTTQSRDRLSPLFAELRRFVLLRWFAAVAVMLGSVGYLFWFGATNQGIWILLIGAAIFVYNLLLWLGLWRVQNDREPAISLVALSWLQIGLDLLCLTALVLITNGVHSPLLGLFVLHMVFASLLLSPGFAYLCAATAVGLVVTGLTVTGQGPQTTEQIMIGLGWGTTLFLTAFLTNRITGSLRDREVRIRNQRSYLQAILDTAADGIVTIDADGIIQSVNRATERIFGYEADELIGENIRILMPEPFRSEHDQYIANYLRTGESQIIGNGREVMGRRKNGETFPLDAAVSDVSLHQQRHFTGIVRDISKRKEAEDNLRESQRALFALISNLPGLAYRCRNEKNWPMEFISDGCVELTGYSVAALTSDEVTWSSLIHPDDRDEVWNHIQAKLSEKFPFQLTYRIRHSDGGWRWVWEQGCAVYTDDGAVAALEGFITDITNRKEAEDRNFQLTEELKRQQKALVQSEKMAAMGQLAAGVAHEIANPLASMDSLLQLAKRQPERINEQTVDKLREPIDRIRRIIQQMTNFAHRNESEWVTSQLNGVIEDAMDMVRFDHRIRGVAIERDLDPNVGAHRLIPHAIQQVVVNLILNALDAMEGTAKPTLHIRTGRNPQGDGCFIEIADNGAGIPADEQSRIFEPFYTTKPVGKGTGLGLSISYALIQQHEGTIEVSSTPGEGTTFTIRLRYSSESDDQEPNGAGIPDSGNPQT